jgi:chorismate mutase
MIISFSQIVTESRQMRREGKPFVIAGPCSAESEEQVVETVRQLASTGRVKLIRAGIWKPRTRPNSFEGMGEPALYWLKKAGRQFQLPVAVEVANASHVEAALRAEIDVVWIGARTTVNPFSVQEIADALKGTEIPVMIKNPVNPDLQLWLGAAERISNAGITSIAAIHRGFSSFSHSVYRNEPMWEIPIAFRLAMPDIPMFCDPSHISGKRELLSLVAQRAMDMGMEGLMIETHPSPDLAWSDARQQILPQSLGILLEGLVIRQEMEGSEAIDRDELLELRSKIDDIDERIIDLIAARMEVSRAIGVYKKEHGLSIFQLERWMEILRTRKSRGAHLNLSTEFLDRYLEQIHSESIAHQTRIMNPGKNDGEILW